MYFLVKVKLTRQLENGTFARVTEQYLVNANTFGEAETNIYKHLEDVRGEFRVLAITHEDVHEIHYDNESESFFKVKIKMSETDLDSGKEKSVTQVFYVQADVIAQVNKSITDIFGNTTLEYKITSAVLSPVIEVVEQIESESAESISE